MVYLPSVLAKYAVEKERTAFEMHKFLSELVANDGSEIDESQAKFLLQWFMAAGQKEHGAAGTAQQKVALKLEVVVSVEPEFVHWAHKQLCSYVGQGPIKPATQLQQPQPLQTDVYLRSVTQVLTEFATSHRAAF
jgi:hypothetical protein